MPRGYALKNTCHWLSLNQMLRVNSIISYKGKIYVGGDFDEAGGADAENISVWKED